MTMLEYFEIIDDCNDKDEVRTINWNSNFDNDLDWHGRAGVGIRSSARISELESVA